MSVKVTVRIARMWVQTMSQRMPNHPMSIRKVVAASNQIPIIIILRQTHLCYFLSHEAKLDIKQACSEYLLAPYNLARHGGTLKYLYDIWNKT